MPENTAQSAQTNSAPPAMGVHKPAHNNSPAAPSIPVLKDGCETNTGRTLWAVETAAISRRDNRPTPGQPRAKEEYRRCKSASVLSVSSPPNHRNPNGSKGVSLFRV